jgi:hypothetical protein
MPEPKAVPQSMSDFTVRSRSFPPAFSDAISLEVRLEDPEAGNPYDYQWCLRYLAASVGSSAARQASRPPRRAYAFVNPSC